MMTNTLKQHLQKLHLSGLLSSLELRLQEAEANRLPHAQFLELLLQDEINVRHQRMLARRPISGNHAPSKTSISASILASNVAKFMNWPPVTSCVSTGTCCWSARQVSARAI